MREAQREMLLRRLADGVPEVDAYHYAGLPLDSARESNAQVNRRLDREQRFRSEYMDAVLRGAQRRADFEHPWTW